MIARIDYEFANDVRAAEDARASRSVTVHILATVLLVVLAFGWAALAHVEEVTTGLGRVISSRQLQVVQTLDGGIVRAVYVREGERVVEGQEIAQLNDTGLASRLGELTTRRATLQAELLRQEAEASGAATFAAGGNVDASLASALGSEIEAFRARRMRQDIELAVLTQQLDQREQELEELRQRKAKLEATLELLEQELRLNRQLLRTKAVPELDVLRLERQRAEMAGDLGIVTAGLPRSEKAIEEARSRIAGARAVTVAQARERLAVVNGELAVIEQSINAASDRVVRAALRAPVRGIVNKLHVTTVGAVVQPGQLVAEVVPLDDVLLIEARIRPQDVAFIRPGLNANVKLTAYDYLLYGTLPGTVERIGADTITDARGETFYQAIVRAQPGLSRGPQGEMTVLPGMVATVDILTGSKTVLSYLLKPVLQTRNEAFRER